MYCGYKDIRERISEPPKWFDENAVPRYCDFHPHEAADIYANEAALCVIACQNCGVRFKVCFAWNNFDMVRNIPRLSERMDSLHYGDPPNADCCCAGATMNSEMVGCIEFWSRASFDWERVPALERVLDA
jgi:hypothetical protein